MMKKEFEMLINDSVLRTRSAQLHMCILFIGCFLVQFAGYVILEKTEMIRTERLEEVIPLLALVTSTLAVCIFYYIREKRTAGVMMVRVNIDDDRLQLAIGSKKYLRDLSDIKEIRKTMIIDRIHNEKGKYRIKVCCHGKGTWIFESTEQEYEKHLDFENTELYRFYDACRSVGIKCC